MTFVFILVSLRSITFRFAVFNFIFVSYFSLPKRLTVLLKDYITASDPLQLEPWTGRPLII